MVPQKFLKKLFLHLESVKCKLSLNVARTDGYVGSSQVSWKLKGNPKTFSEHVTTARLSRTRKEEKKSKKNEKKIKKQLKKEKGANSEMSVTDLFGGKVDVPGSYFF